MNGMAVCAGYGGLELALRIALGDGYRTVCYAERDLVAAGVLAARMEDGSLEPAPIWDDLRTIDGAAWRGLVDILTAGFPCQPFSVAGRRLGLADDRWIWPDIARVIREVGPSFVFLENVPGLVRHGLGAVLGSLAEAGYVAEWDCFTASEVGAPHKRERLFIVAHHNGAWEPQPEERELGIRRRSLDRRQVLADADRQRLKAQCGAKPAGAQHRPTEHIGGPVANTDGGRGRAAVRPDPTQGTFPSAIWQEGDALSGATGNQLGHPNCIYGREGWVIPPGEPDDQGTGIRLFPPGPDDAAGWLDYLAGSPEVEPAVRFPTHGSTGRLDELFLLGNGVVPLAAAYAFVTLAARLGWRMLR